MQLRKPVNRRFPLVLRVGGPLNQHCEWDRRPFVIGRRHACRSRNLLCGRPPRLHFRMRFYQWSRHGSNSSAAT